MAKRELCSECGCADRFSLLHCVEWTDAAGVKRGALLCDDCYDEWADSVGERVDE